MCVQSNSTYGELHATYFPALNGFKSDGVCDGSWVVLKS